jgi:Ca2+-binding RTX toxin-like protein
MKKLAMLFMLVAILTAMFAAPVLAKVITGTNKDDLIDGSRHIDHINGLRGNDAIWGWASPDVLFGGSGGDDMFGGSGADYITGGRDHDYLWGKGGNDVIDAQDGHKDYVDCGPGVDRIYIDYTTSLKDTVFMKKTKCEFVNGVDTR